jgi:hypothetical protein
MDANDLIRVGKNLVPFLRRHMPRLQTLRLWRPDDFPWTSSMYLYIFSIEQVFNNESSEQNQIENKELKIHSNFQSML